MAYGREPMPRLTIKALRRRALLMSLATVAVTGISALALAPLFDKSAATGGYDYTSAALLLLLLMAAGSIASMIAATPIADRIEVSAGELEQAVADRTGRLEQEVADHKRAQENLRQFERRFQDIIESTEDWVWEVDASKRFTYASAKAAAIVGYTPEEIVGRTPFDFMDEAEAARVAPIFLEHARKMAPFHHIENANRRKDGTLVHLETTGFPLLSEDGRLLGFRGVNRDITDRKRAEAEIREREELYRTAFRTSPDAINITRLADGVFVDINEGFTAHTGYTREDVIGRSSIEVGIWADAADRSRLLEGLRTDGFVENLEAQYRRKDGGLTTALMSARFIAIRGMPHILSITRDITERKAAEILLKESEARSRLLLDRMSIGFGIDGLDGRMISPNEGLARLLGCTAEELLDMRFTDCADPEHAEGDRVLFEELAAGKREGYQIEKPYVTKDGRRVWGRVTRALVRDEKGRPEYCLAAFEDITGRKDLEQSLIQREAQISGILEASPAAIVLKDTERRYLMVNAAYEDFQDVSPETVLGRRAEEFQRPEQAAVTRREDQCVLDTGAPCVFGEITRGRDGGERHFSVVKFPVWDRRRRIIGIGMIAIEITREKQVEQELRAAKERAEAANRTKTLFLANMSHELRTPLNSILGFSEIIALEMFGPLSARYREYANLVRKSGGHLLGIINDLLDMSRIETEKVDLDVSSIEVGRLIEESIGFLDEMARSNNVTIRTRCAPDHRMPGDPRRMKQVFINILSNAIKFSPGGTVTIRAACGAKGHRIVFRDTGIGMSSEDIALALQPFGQAEQSSEVRRFQGTGLGLPIAKRLVELHGGTLEVASVKGRGTTVTVRLPDHARTSPRRAVAKAKAKVG